MIKMKLHLLLAERQLNQKDIAEELNIPKNTVSKYVNNTFSMINKDHLDLLCKYFDCNVQDILEYQDNSKYDLRLGAWLDNSSTLKETSSTYKTSYSNKTSKELFYEYVKTHMGQLTYADICKYALYLCEDDTTITYEGAINMVEKINNQYKPN